MHMIRYAMCNCNNRLLGREELAEWLGIKPQTISNLLSRGEDLPKSIKIGGARRWPKQEVQKWIDAHLKSST